MTFSVPALLDEVCPKCGESNPNDRAVRVWRVVDERGLHHECASCSHAWWPPVTRRRTIN